MVKPDHKLLDI